MTAFWAMASAISLGLAGLNQATALAADPRPPTPAGPAAAPPPGKPGTPPAAPKPNDGLIDLDLYEPTEIRVLAAEVARWIGKNILVDEQVRGKVQIIAPRRVTKEEAYQAFLSSLNMLGLTTVETGRIVKIVRLNEAIKANPQTYTRPVGSAKNDQVLTQIVALRYISAERIRSILSRFITSNAMVAHAETNTLIISDSGYNVERALAIIALMDVDTQQPHMLMLPVRHGSVKDIATKVREYIKMMSGGSRVSQYHSYAVATDERSNSLILIGPPGGLNLYRDFVKQLDAPLPSSGEADAGIFVRPLEYADAKKLAVTIAAISGASRPQPRPGAGWPGVPGMPGGPAAARAQKDTSLKVTADEASNALIISGSRGAYHATNRVIRQLDVRKPQVFLEADVLEINSNHQFVFGSSILAGAGNKDGTGTKVITGWQAGAMAPLVIAGSDAGQAVQGTSQAKEVAAALADGLSVGVLAGEGVQVPGIGRVSPGALLKLLKGDSDSRILSSPYILTVDNEEASLSVGETVFFKSTASDVQGLALTKVDKENIDLSLTVKPTIGTGSYLSLKIGIEAKSIAGLTAEGVPRVAKRKATQLITLKEGQTAVVAGVNQREQRETNQKVPLLGDVPILGALFRTRMQMSGQSQIAVFLTPHVVRGADDLSRIYREKLEDVRQFLQTAHGLDAKEDDFFSELPSIEDGKSKQSVLERHDQQQRLRRRQAGLTNWGYTDEKATW